MSVTDGNSLSQLISRLKDGINRKSSYVKTIRYPRLLVKSLQELDDVIGNQSVKDSVAKQITHLIMVKRREMSGAPVQDGDVMLNTVLCGPPGVGKTSVGCKLAKIWYSLGYLKKGDTADVKVTTKIMSGVSDPENAGIVSSLLPMFLFIFGLLIYYAFVGIRSVYTNYGLAYAILLLGIVIITLILVYHYLTTPSTSTSNTVEIKKDQQREQGTNNPETQKNQSVDAKNTDGKQHDTVIELPEETTFPSDDEIIKVVTRADFVGQYLGWTAPKTLKLLRENLGKVLFVDEAYSFIESPDDQYGMEALTELNLFMSQHPGEIIIIFAGYQDLLEAGPFTAQPGLRRRFMWQFTCEGYSSDELYEIFLVQLAKSGRRVRNPDHVRHLFKQNADAFPAYGGDTERLAFFAALEHSEDYMTDESDLDVNMLETNQVQRGLAKLRENNIKPCKTSTNPIANMMKMMSKRGTESDNEHMEQELFGALKNKAHR